MHMNENSEHLTVSDIDTAVGMFTNSICATSDKQAQKHIETSAQQEANAFILAITPIFNGLKQKRLASTNGFQQETVTEKQNHDTVRHNIDAQQTPEVEIEKNEAKEARVHGGTDLIIESHTYVWSDVEQESCANWL